jgi:hypothetical protein
MSSLRIAILFFGENENLSEHAEKYINAQRIKHIVILKLRENCFSRYGIYVYEQGST